MDAEFVLTLATKSLYHTQIQYAVITKCVSFSTCIWKTIQNLVI